MKDWAKERMEEDRFEQEQREQSERIMKRIKGKRALPAKDVIEIQRKKAVATWEKCRHG